MAGEKALSTGRAPRKPLGRLTNPETRIDLVIGLILALFSFVMFYPFLWLI